MAANESLVSAVRAEIERKYRDAIRALETISGYLADSPATTQTGVEPKQESDTDKDAGGKTRVDRVIEAIAVDYKTVEQLHQELGIPEEKVRAVLYSRFVKPRIVSKKVGKKYAFRSKPASTATATTGSNHSNKSQASPPEKSIASVVREILVNNPNGLTAKQITASVDKELLATVANGAKAVGAALFKLKRGGKVAHSEETGVYRLTA